jgi:hypothetical protein
MFGNSGRNDSTFEMKQAVPFVKLGVLVIGAVIVLLVFGLFFVRVTRVDAGFVGILWFTWFTHAY